MAKDTKYRVAFVKDRDAKFEECNGQRRPLTETEYAENQYRGCPDHMRAGSKVVDASVSPNIVVCAECGRDSKEWIDIPYAEYRAYHGNPTMHRYIGTIVESQEGIGDWTVVASVWGSDFMRDDPALKAVTITEAERVDLHYYTVEQALALPGYFADLAREELIEAGAIKPAQRRAR